MANKGKMLIGLLFPMFIIFVLISPPSPAGLNTDQNHIHTLTNVNDGEKNGIVLNTSNNRITAESSCSERASLRGAHQKVVSFSFFGQINHTRKYFKGIEENAKLMQKIYPNWIIRVYIKVPFTSINTSRTLKEMETKYDNLDICNTNNLPQLGKLTGIQGKVWRFMPVADPLVDVFVSRDLDSRVSEREADAVKEWLQTNLTFHIMRDHPYHRVPILGGMWGARVSNNRTLMSEIWQKMYKRGAVPESKGNDQHILAHVVWPLVNGDSVQHDSYHCKMFKMHKFVKPWPTKRKVASQNFVGSRYLADDTPLSVTCPLECRPKQHPDWVSC